MISLSREKTIEVEYLGEKVTVTYKVPSAIEAETLLKDQTNAGLFKAFVQKVQSDGVSEWTGGVGAEECLNAPGTYSLVNEVDLAIVDSAILRKEEKN